MSVVVRKCTVSEIENTPNIDDFLAQYASESVATDAPNHCAQMETYKEWEKAGSLYTVGAFMDNMLIGIVNIIKPILPHYGVSMAVTESIFVLKDYRKTGVGMKLIFAAKNYAKEINSFGLLISAPVGGDLAFILSQMDDFQETNRVFFMKVKQDWDNLADMIERGWNV